MAKLGVNIDHVATLRQARQEFEPDPIEAAIICQKAGADSIVCHLREDRRHINDKDVIKLRKVVKKPLNLEMSLNSEIVRFAASIKPDYAMFVPERRREVTTEGGLDVVKYANRIKSATKLLKKKGIMVSLFIDPSKKQIDKAKAVGAEIIELHTGPYANARSAAARKKELQKIKTMSRYAKSLGLVVHAGHGLKYHNTRAVTRIKDIEKLNIGHSIISRSVFVGLETAVKEMKKIVST